MNSVAIALGGSALLALMVVFAARSDVPQTVGTTVSVREDDQFDEVWRKAAVNYVEIGFIATNRTQAGAD